MASVKSEVKQDVLIISVNELRLLDDMTIRQVYNEAIALIEKRREPKVLVQFDWVDFMSSGALGMLVTLHERCKGLDLRLRLSGISDDIREVFRITGLEKIFDISPDAASAIESFRDDRPGTAGVLAKIEPLGPDPMRPYGGPIDRELRQREKKEPDA